MATLEEAETADYFESYDNISVHNVMLRDRPRVEKYREAIFKSKNLFKDKIVLDCGSGTGVLSMFAAQAGAKKVYAIEASHSVYQLSKAIISENNLSDQIEVINGEIEKIKLPVDQVDIIISEWMGFYLLHEGMLGSVLYARDKWLKPDGHMFPSVAYLYVSPVEMTEYLQENVTYWSNFYNLNYSVMQRVYRSLLLEKPVIECIKNEQLIDDEKILDSFDLKTVTMEDLESIQDYDLKFTASRDCQLHGFALWFDVVFVTDDDVVTLSTSPASEDTHWKQTIALLPQALDSFSGEDESSSLTLKEDQEFKCYVILNQSEDNPRNYVIDIGVDLGNEEEEEDEEESEDEEEHPTPCDCGKMRCLIIKATLEKYEKESTSK